MSPHLAAGRMLHVGACRCVASCPVQFGWRGWGRLALSAQVPQGEQAAPARQLSEREPENAITPVRMPNAGARLSRGRWRYAPHIAPGPSRRGHWACFLGNRSHWAGGTRPPPLGGHTGPAVVGFHGASFYFKRHLRGCLIPGSCSTPEKRNRMGLGAWVIGTVPGGAGGHQLPPMGVLYMPAWALFLQNCPFN